MVLESRRVAPIPREVPAGAPFRDADRLEVWICEMNPKRHVEVRTWGLRPVKDCSVDGCNGVMVHSDKARMTAPDDISKQPGKPYALVKYEAGWVCLDNRGHFEPGRKPSST
jgi:hypothetical protein